MNAAGQIDAANHVLWFFDHDEGFEPGSFVQSLLQTMALADTKNMARLTLEYPELGTAMIRARFAPRGLDMLREEAG